MQEQYGAAAERLEHAAPTNEEAPHQRVRESGKDLGPSGRFPQLGGGGGCGAHSGESQSPSPHRSFGEPFQPAGFVWGSRAPDGDHPGKIGSRAGLPPGGPR